MNEMMDTWRNADGTFNGIKMLADLSGRSVEETAGIAKTFRECMAQGVTREQIMAILKDVLKENQDRLKGDT